MWWEKAQEKFAETFRGKDISKDRTYGYDEDDYYEEDEMKSRMRLPVLMRAGEVEFIRVKPGMTVKELLNSITDKVTYGLILVKRDAFNRILGRVILDGSERLEDMHGIYWDAKSASTSNVWLVDLTQEVNVFFNTYFRMSTGVPSHLQRLYLQPGMTVGEFESMLKASLMIDEDDMRMGLYGHVNDEVIRLDEDMLMSELRERETDPSNPRFFQFQFHKEAELDENLGSSRASNLFMRANRGTRRMKKCWFSLQGTTLFYRPNQTDHGWSKKIERIDLCKVIYRGANASRDAWRFDLVPPEGHGPVRVFTSPLKRRIVRWVRELRGAHHTLELNEPVTMESLKKSLPDHEIEPASHLTKGPGSGERLLDVNFYQRRLLEIAEAQLNKVELDAGVLLMNGLDRIDEDLGRKWVDSVRALLHHCLKIQATQTAHKVVSDAKEVLKRLRDWVEYFEDLAEARSKDRDVSPLPTPRPATIKEICEDSANLVNTFRFYVINLNDQSGIITNKLEKQQLEEILETMQDALSQSIFDGKAKRKVIVRGSFRSKEELKEAKRLQKEEEAKEQARRKADKEKAKRRKEREKKGLGTVWSVVNQPSPREQVENAGPYMNSARLNRNSIDDLRATATNNNNNQYEDEEEMIEERPIKKSGWLRSKLATIFKAKPMTRNPYQIEDVEADIPDDGSFNMSMQNGERLGSETRWEETEAMFKKYAKKNSKNAKSNGKELKDEEEGETSQHQTYIQLPPLPDSPIIRSGFNNYGQMRQKPAATTVNNNNIWRVPETREEAVAGASTTSSSGANTLGFDYATSAPLLESGPLRAGPEDEALLLRMLKDPRVKDLLQEFRQGQAQEQEDAALVKQKQRSATTTSPAVQEMASWGRRRA